MAQSIITIDTVKEKSITNAISSVKMEGYKFSEYHERLCKDVINGKMSKQDCIKQLIANRDEQNAGLKLPKRQQKSEPQEMAEKRG